MVTNELGQKLGSVRSFYKALDGKFYFNIYSENIIGYFDENNLHAQFIKNTPDNHFQGNEVYQTEQGLNDDIWMATTYGIESLNINNHTFDVIYKNPKELSITNFYLDKDRTTVWIIADGGLLNTIGMEKL